MVLVMYSPAALAWIGAVSGCGRFHFEVASRTPFMRSAPNRFGQAQAATIRWMRVACAETESCSEPRQASGRM